MAKKRPSRMLPPSQRPKQLNEDASDFKTNLAMVDQMLGNCGAIIHEYHDNAKMHGVPGSTDATDVPLAVIVTHDAFSGPFRELAADLYNGPLGRSQIRLIGCSRQSFEAKVSRLANDALSDLRGELDKMYAMQDGPPVAVLLKDCIFTTTCVNRLQAN